MKTPARETGFAICVRNEGAEDLDLRKVYRVLPDKAAATEGYLRVVDESSEDYLYPAEYFVFVDLPPKARRALAAARGKTRPRRLSSPAASRRTSARPARLSL